MEIKGFGTCMIDLVVQRTAQHRPGRLRESPVCLFITKSDAVISHPNLVRIHAQVNFFEQLSNL
jgi:hypothetical protein